ncbi:hypothetical protein AB1Y20_021875 [Prymnesium parvum]|uniref:AAA+ ATPase domain-containing protein n=1 Tax=Prymnesium parvum TaxID=97485 RepID=A0AB34JJZ0_PRYPA
MRRLAPLSRAIRIYAVDRVPGVTSAASGAQLKQSLRPEAMAGAQRLAAAVQRQRDERRREPSCAKEEMAKEEREEGAEGGRGAALGALLRSLDGAIGGQRLAKDAVARAMRRRALRLDDTERPLRLLFAGPSGVGKTAMAVGVCEALVGSCVPERNFKRFNLSEFSHPSKFNRLTGGDPNYVGYKEGGELTNFIRQAEERRARRLGGGEHTSCVLLLDEVDRAADGLLTFLMNFLDQGQLTDGRGETVDASRAVVIMTTNCGQAPIKAAAHLSRAGDHEVARRQIVSMIRGEVLKDICDGRWENLGRLGAIVPFLPLDAEGRADIVTRQLRGIATRLSRAKSPAVLSRWTDGVVAALAAQWDEDLGGRSTRDAIESNVVEAIAEALDGLSSTGSAPVELELDVEEGSSAEDLCKFVCRVR